MASHLRRVIGLDIRLRLEEPADYREVEELTREAFWDTPYPPCDEHYLVHKLRDVPAFIPELDYVAELDGKIVGNIMYSRAKIVDDSGAEHEVITFGPISVLPGCQRRGIGQALLRHTISEAKRLGYRAIVFFGHPDYYPRVGFRRAGEFGILTSKGTSYDAHMAMPLYEGALDGITGRFCEDPVFESDPDEVIEFDKGFLHKEYKVLEPIDVLLDRLGVTPQSALATMMAERRVKYLRDLSRFSGREIASWPGVDAAAKQIINSILREYGYPPKIFE